MNTPNTDVTILVIDDEPLIRKSLSEIFKLAGYHCLMAESAEEAVKIIQKNKIDILLTDMKLPNMSGIELLKKAKKMIPDMEVIMMTGYGSIETAVGAMKLGAFDYITKPIVDDEIKLIIRRIIEKKSLVNENISLKEQAKQNSRQTFMGIVGACSEMQTLYRLIESVSNTNAAILITGESGTGKGMIARAIHNHSQTHSKNAFIEVSCGALSETLLESELFGHVKGAFTGAIKDKSGRFESANGGTIFLDEIDTCSPALQVKLLRILQDGTYERVGDNLTRKTDARVITATNQNLVELVDKGQFREDLYYRIHVIPIPLVPLRQRMDDLELLVNHFLGILREKNKKKITGVSKEVIALFKNYSWPGNVRQLENVLEGSFIISRGPEIQIDDLPKSFNSRSTKEPQTSVKNPSGEVGSLKDSLKSPEKEIIIAALKEAHGNRSLAAEKLGINRTTLYNKMKKYGIASKQ